MTRPRSPRGPGDSGRRPARHRIGVFLAGALVGAMAFSALVDLAGETANRWGVSATWLGENTERPTPRPAQHQDPLGTPLPPPARSGPFEFLATQPGSDTPVTYDPCRPIPVVVNNLRAPAGSADLLRNTLDRMTEITGFQFEIEGTTTEVPDLPRPAYQPERYGDRWAPVLIIWATEDDVPDLAGYGGLGGSTAAPAPGTSTHVYVSGVVVLNGPSFRQTLTVSRGWFLAEAVILHELGHLLGLDHVDDPRQLMHHDAPERYDFGHGDLTGLAALSSGPCVDRL